MSYIGSVQGGFKTPRTTVVLYFHSTLANGNVNTQGINNKWFPTVADGPGLASHHLTV